MTTNFSEIPRVSLAPWRDGDDAARAVFAEDLRRICHEVGFLTLVDHGIEQEFLDRYFAALAEFFALPEETKAVIDKKNSRYFRGWERVGAELTGNRVDYREQLDLSTENPPYDEAAEPPYLRLDGPNQWLPNEVLPGFQELVSDYFARLGALADELMQILALGLSLPADTFARVFGERPMAFAKLISYPPTPPGEMGVNEHHDAGFLTILAQNGVAGLQAESADGQWIDVPPERGTFVINLGEMLQSMTGNYYVATNHRVITEEARFSAAYFHGPDLRSSLAPLELADEFAEAVASSPRHRDAGFMAKRNELLAGEAGIGSTPVPVFGEQMWNYYVRSYPDMVRAYYPELV